MTIIEWNINLRSNSNEEIPPFVATVINNQNADIVVLTEFVKASNWIDFVNSLKEYNVFYSSECTKGNEILIAVKKCIPMNAKEEKMKNDKDDLNPNFLQIDLIVNNKSLKIIGTRIRTRIRKKLKQLKGESIFDFNKREEKHDELELFEDFKSRNTQIDLLTEYVKDIKDPSLVIGDFNNCKTGYLYNRNNVKWGFSFIKKSFKDIGFKASTPNEGFSWSCNKFKLDHIFARGVNVTTKPYSWAFMEHEKEVYNTGNNYKPESPYPDHAILIAEIDIP